MYLIRTFATVSAASKYDNGSSNFGTSLLLSKNNIHPNTSRSQKHINMLFPFEEYVLHLYKCFKPLHIHFIVLCFDWYFLTYWIIGGSAVSLWYIKCISNRGITSLRSGLKRSFHLSDLSSSHLYPTLTRDSLISNQRRPDCPLRISYLDIQWKWRGHCI